MLKRPDFSILQKPSIVLIIFCACFSIWTMDYWRQWRYADPGNHPFRWDVAGYYSYLPATFINDYSFNFNNELDFYCTYAPLGGKMSKGTYGMSLMYSPFFAIAYKISANTNSKLDGLSYYFGTCIHWGSIFYGLLGLLVLRNLLIKFFSEKVTAITLAIIFFGTNLFCYVLSVSEYSHSYLFLLISCFLLLTYHWYNKPTYARSAGLGLVLGLITLIRPTEILTGSLFVFWMAEGSRTGLRARFQLLLSKWKHLLLMTLMAFVLWVPQFLFWKYKTGHYLFFSYPGERFFWTDPQVLNILFSYRKGWFVYTPLILFSFIGFFFMKGRVKPLKFPILALIVVNIYILSCWWDWLFGGSFGARCFIQHYAFLAIPMASFIAFIFEEMKQYVVKPLIQMIVACIIFSGGLLNIEQTFQSSEGLMHFDSMTGKAYWLVFGKYKLVGSDVQKYWGALRAPDYDKMRSGENRRQ